MKTVKCSECNEEIPINSIVCPKCNTRCLSTKSRITAIILSFCLGIFGAHNFYLGFINKGLVSLACTTLSIILIIAGIFNNQLVFWMIGLVLLIFVFIYAVFEGVLLIKKIIFRDAKGKRLK